MDEVQRKRKQFDYLHGDKGGLKKLCQLLEDYTFSYNRIAQYFGFSSGSTYIAHLIQRLGLDSKRGYLTLQDKRNNFDQIYRARGGVQKLVEMLKAQASVREIAQQFGIDEKRVKEVLRRLVAQDSILAVFQTEYRGEHAPRKEDAAFLFSE